MGGFKNIVILMRILALIMVLAVFFYIFSLGKNLKLKKRRTNKAPSKPSALEAEEEWRPAGVRRTRRIFLKDLKVIGQLSEKLSRNPSAEEEMELQRKLFESVRVLILGELPELSRANTPEEIERYIKNVLPKNDYRREELLVLAQKLLSYERDLENERSSIFGVTDRSFSSELEVLSRLVREWRYFRRFKRLFANIFGKKR